MSDRVQYARAEVERALSRLATMWSGDTTFTFIARNPKIEGREMIVTSDPDIKGLADLLLKHHAQERLSEGKESK